LRRLDVHLESVLGLPYGACDATNGYEAAAALWRSPKQWHIPIWQYIASGAEFLGLFGVGGAARVISWIVSKSGNAGAALVSSGYRDRSRQAGKGFGGVLIRHPGVADIYVAQPTLPA
jgi:hypothetical protein